MIANFAPICGLKSKGLQLITMSEQRQSQTGNVRLSFADYTTNPAEIYRGMFQLSYLNSGDQTTHMHNTHDYMVVQHKWLSETQFSQIYNLCWSLPGPTTMQLIVTIITLKLKSLSAALTSLLIYNILPLLLLVLLGLFSNYFLSEPQSKFGLRERMVLMGFSAAAAGIMLRSFLIYFKQCSKNFAEIVLITFSAVMFYKFRSQNSIIFSLVVCGLVSLYLQFQNESRKKMSNKSQNLFSKLSFNFLLGKPSLIILVVIFFSLWIFFSIYPDNHYAYIFTFYLVGCIIIGPIEVIFAYFLSILLQYPTINITQMWIGFSFTFLVPGSHINIGMYFGSLIDGMLGGVLAVLALYLPFFLFLMGALPQWKHYREKGGIKRMYQGLVCSTTGLTLAVIIIIMEHCMQLDIACSVQIFIICAVANYFLSRYAFMTILIGGALGFARYVALYCYKLGTDCFGPFNF